MSGNIRAAIIGGSESGKTFLGIGLSRGLWRFQKLRSLVFDPWKHERKRKHHWGPQAWVTTNFEEWKRVVMSVQGCAVFWDEASTNGGDDDDNAPLFTEIRHRHPVLVAMGHCHGSIARKMRVNLTDLYLALADDVDAVLWARTMKDPALKEACKETALKQYQFMHKRPYQPVKIRAHSEAEILGGILP